MPSVTRRRSLCGKARGGPENIVFRAAAAVIVLVSWHGGAAQAVCNGEAEKALRNAMKIEQEWPLRPGQDSATRYLQRLGERLIAASGADYERPTDHDWPAEGWHFSIVRDLSVNAFSIGNGRIYLTDGSVRFVNSEAELAAILAHEIAHQLAGHFCSNGRLMGGERQIGSLIQVMDNTKEMQADLLALDILRAAGFPQAAMLQIVKRLPLSGDMRQQQQRIEALRHNLPAFDEPAAFSNSREFTELKESLRQ